MLFSVFLLAQNKIFVILPSIVRGKNRAVEGNLCLYPDIQNLENFEVDMRYEFASLICIQQVFLLMHTGWENVSVLLQGCFPEPVCLE